MSIVGSSGLDSILGITRKAYRGLALAAFSQFSIGAMAQSALSAKDKAGVAHKVDKKRDCLHPSPKVLSEIDGIGNHLAEIAAVTEAGSRSRKYQTSSFLMTYTYSDNTGVRAIAGAVDLMKAKKSISLQDAAAKFCSKANPKTSVTAASALVNKLIESDVEAILEAIKKLHALNPPKG